MWYNIYTKLREILGICVMVAQQTLTLLVGVQSSHPQPYKSWNGSGPIARLGRRGKWGWLRKRKILRLVSVVMKHEPHQVFNSFYMRNWCKGSHVSLRSWCRKACEFESHIPHHSSDKTLKSPIAWIQGLRVNYHSLYWLDMWLVAIGI